MKFKIADDRHPGRRIWLGSFEETIAGLEIRARVKMKPRLLRVSEDRWLRVDAEETLYIERDLAGKGVWHTLRGPFHDLEAPDFDSALEKASRGGVFVKVSPNYAVSPQRIVGIRLQRKGFHELELEGAMGNPVKLPLHPSALPILEECLDAINLGDGFLITGPEDDEGFP